MEQQNFYTFEEQTSGKQTPTKEELLQGIEETYQEHLPIYTTTKHRTASGHC